MNSTIYIRKSNEEYWNAIEDKSAWINAMLLYEFHPGSPKFKNTVNTEVKDDIEFCKHNAVKGMCKKGCK